MLTLSKFKLLVDYIQNTSRKLTICILIKVELDVFFKSYPSLENPFGYSIAIFLSIPDLSAKFKVSAVNIFKAMDM